MSFVETALHYARMLAECRTQPAEDTLRNHLQIMLNKAQALKAERDQLRAENEALRRQVIVHDAAHSELCREVGVLRGALYKAAEYATLAYEGSALIDGRIVDGLGLAEWIETILEPAAPKQEPSHEP